MIFNQKNMDEEINKQEEVTENSSAEENTVNAEEQKKATEVKVETGWLNRKSKSKDKKEETKLIEKISELELRLEAECRSREEMVKEMVQVDLDAARQHALLKQHGYSVAVSRE